MFKRSFFVVLLSVSYVFFSLQYVYAQQETSKIFESGDTICFLGDSITHGGQFHEFLQLFHLK